MTSQHSEERAVAVATPAALETYGTGGLVGRFTAIADEIAPLIKAREWAVNMGKGEHVKIEGWTCCGAIMGIGPSTKAVREIVNGAGDVIGYEAHVAICRAVDGIEIGSAINECRVTEVTKRREDGAIVKRWVQPDGTANHHAMKSMAQTRAASKALASWCRPVIEMAGYKGTPYEEMPPNAYDEDAQPKAQERRQAASMPATGAVTGSGGVYVVDTPGPEDAAFPQSEREQGSEPYTPEGEYSKWLDDPSPIRKGDMAGKTWRWFSQGSPEGKRVESLRWMVDTFEVGTKGYDRARRVLAFIEGGAFNE